MPHRPVVLLAAALVLAAGTGASASPASAEVPASELATRAIAKDPVGDGVGRGALAVRRADLVRASYRTPRVEGGTITVRVTWAELRRTGPFQRLHVSVDPRTSGKQQPSAFEGARSGVSVQTYERGEPFADRVRPEVLDVQRVYGERGTTTVTMSTEWLEAPAGRVEVTVLSEAGSRASAAFDSSAGRDLRVGPVTD
ncbi:hypothetical protein GCM10009737_05640 [Nocardioides lentus]|uniref:Uncharacterized protein n=1 Tax=Nocardioides lentus TaxID=338077 RepID=A0ABP5A989_9ACTN